MKKSTQKRIIIYSAIVLIIVAVVLISNAVKSNNEKMAQFDVSPSTAIATTEDIGIYVPASGTINSGNSETVFADTQGTVVEINYDLGDFVNAGDVIAVVESETLEDEIDSVKNSINSKRSSVDSYDNETQDFTIKSPVYGRVKDINVKYVTSSTSEYYRERAEDIEAEHGYLVSIAVGNSMYIKVTEDINQYEVGDEVDAVIHQEDGDQRVYTGSYVEKIENKTVYIYVDTNKYDDEVEATIYSADGKTAIGTGTTEYTAIEYVVGAEGYIKITSTYANQLVNEGDILYYSYSNISQNLIDMYTELEELEEELSDLQTQYNNLNIKAPVSGFIDSIDISIGDIVNADTAVCKVADTSIWTATVDVDELDINTIDIGMIAIVTIDAIPDEEFEGMVNRISSVGSANSGVTTYTVEIEVPSDERFRLNMNASSEIQVEKVNDAISVPIQAVRYQGNRAYVMVYTERTESEIKEIQNQILDAQDNVEEMTEMSEEERQELMSEMREQKNGENSERGQGKVNGENIDKDGMQNVMGNFAGVSRNSAALSVTDQLYGEMVYVEVGIQDETNIQIINGLKSGDVVLLPISEDSSNSNESSNEGFAMMPGMGGGMGGGRP